ncbi:MAG: GAF domain-containing protein, partial [Magnetococcales bacterium]|nr:GAF domain-containing protein [Magnetococcales bacterium]
DASHPMNLEWKNFDHSSEKLKTILLSPLKKNEITLFLAEMLRQNTNQVEPLTDLCFEKTNGNPFFLGHFLQSLNKNNLIQLIDSEWHWNLDAINKSECTINVIDLMMGKINTVPKDSAEVLMLAAALGGTFDLSTLSLINHTSKTETAKALWPSLQLGLILPLGQDYKLAEFFEEGIFSYRFIHDRVQQAAYSLIPDEKLEEVHLVIGRILLANIPKKFRDEKILDIVGHLNQSIRLIHGREQKLELAILNYQAGQKAKLVASFDMADTFFARALYLVADNEWRDHYGFLLTLHIAGAELAYLAGDYPRMEKILITVLQQAKISLDRVQAYEIQMNAFYAQSRLHESIGIGLTTIRDLDPELAQNLESNRVIAIEEYLSSSLGKRKITELIDLPIMTDERQLAIMRILGEMTYLAYMVGDIDLFLRVIKNMVTLSLRYGNAPSSPACYTGCGIILCTSAIEGSVDVAQEYGQLAIKLAERPENRLNLSSTLHQVGSLVFTWKQHFAQTLPVLYRGFETGQEVGKYHASIIASSAYINRAYYSGQNLEILENKASHIMRVIKRMKQDQLLIFASTALQAILNMRGKKNNPNHLIVADNNQQRNILIYLSSGHVHAFFMIQIHKLILKYLFHKPILALQHILLAKHFIHSAYGNTAITILNFYHSLTRLRLAQDATPHVQIRHLLQVEENQKQLARWAKDSPVNYAHKYQLVEAEKFRVLKQTSQARDHYDEAIRLAQKNEYLNDEALACELSGQFHQDEGRASLARCYLRDAHNAYVSWGALAKAKDLENRFPEYLSRDNEDKYKMQTIQSTNIGQKTTSALLDLPSVIRASELLFGENNLETLLKKLIRLALENAGGQRGCLVLLEEKQLFLKVEGSINPDKVQLLNLSLSDTQKYGDSYLPMAILHYVLRSKKSVILDDANNQEQFANSLYLKTNKPLSVLCVPLVLHSQVVGVLYLENNLTTAVFTKKRVDMMQLLGTQAAISINNAKYLAASKLAEASAVKSKKRVRELSAHMEQTREDEKKRIAIDVHDELGSLLTKLKMDFSWLQKHPPKHATELNQQLTEMTDVLSQVSGTVQRISRSLRPKVLDEFGLTAALDWLMREMSRHGRIKTRWAEPPPEIKLNDLYRTALYRICQEALTNVAKHANANDVVVLLNVDEEIVVLEILDDGDGVDLQQLNSKNSFGVGNMRERVMQLDGQFGLERRKKGGTRLWVNIPLTNKEV